MRVLKISLTAILLVLPGSGARAQELKPEILDRLKSASAYVIVNTPQGLGTGTGFFFLRRDKSAYLLTCEHVVGRAESVTVVLSSGTKAEKTYTARVIATDPNRDLACLAIRDAGDLPSPLTLAKKTDVRETEAVYAAGFPFGEGLSAGDKHPEITITKAAVASIRKDNEGNIATIQISGDVNPGHSGGPLIDAKGRVVGVTMAKILGTQTAFAVPPEELNAFFKGRVKASTFRPVKAEEDSATYEIILDLIDPLGSLLAASIAYIPEDQIKDEPKPGPDGLWGKIHPAMKSLSLKIDDDRAMGTLEIPRPKNLRDPLLLLYQCSFTRADGKTFWTDPAAIRINFEAKEDRSAPSGKPASEPDPGEEAAKGISLAIPDKIPEVGRLKLDAVIPDFILAPDGSALYALDISEGLVYRIDPDKLQITAKVEAPENAVTMALSPNGKTLYVAGREIGAHSRRENKGTIVAISSSPFEYQSSFDVGVAPADLEATDRGILAVTCVSQAGGLAFLDVERKAIEGQVPHISTGAVLRISPDQNRVYLGDLGVSPANYRCVVMRKEGKQYPVHTSPYHGEHPLGGRFEFSPDGRYLLGCPGSVLRLSRVKDADLRQVASLEPSLAIAVARGSETFFAATHGGFLKIYDLGSFELRKSVSIGLQCQRILLDVPRRRLHAVVHPVDPQAGSQPSYATRLGNIVSFDIAHR